MKMKKTCIRYLSAVLAGLMLWGSAVACTSSGQSSDTQGVTDSVTNASTDAVTEGSTENPADTPKTQNFVTTSDLVIPTYTYAIEGATAENNGIIATARDVFADTWYATDGAGRSMPEETATVNERLIGLFYFLWRDADQNTLNPIPATDHYKAYLEGGLDGLWEEMQIGGEGHPHYWAEPYFGYYSSNDEWVLRKHAYMFAEAGVDFVFFDTTNNNIHERSFMALLKVWEEVKHEGYDVPKIVFLCGGYTAEFNELWNKVYAKGLYEDLWFYWNGKPLILFSGDVTMTDEQSEFFTWRLCWANSGLQWYMSRNGKGCWLWNDPYPQLAGKDWEGNTESIIVMCGYGANGGWGTDGGRSYSNKHAPYEGDWDMGFALMETTTGLGLLFDYQFRLAMRRPQEIMMITGWNEWIAGRWSGAGAGAAGVGQRIANHYVVSADPNVKESTYFVDQFNPEYSRDLEPMKGGFGDNYFYQMTGYIREYRGSREVESAFGQWAIDITGSVGQWYSVGPEFRDYEGDVTHRHSPGHVGGNEYGFYENNTGRNDIVTAKVSTDSKNVYFYVECADTITTPDGETNWMNLFINSDGDSATGWYGYDFILNRSQKDNTVSVERFTGTNTWDLELIGYATYHMDGKVLQVQVSRNMIGFNGTLDFKWADNSVKAGDDIMGFIDLGDAAPNDRFTYHFTLEDTDFEEKVPACLTDDMVVIKSMSYNAYVGGQQIRLVENNTKATAICSDTAFWLPVDFVENTLNISCKGQDVYNHYGVDYVRADEVVVAAGKVVTIYAQGMVVIADAEITDWQVLRTLYRALS